MTEAVIRDSATGQITGTVKIVTYAFPAPVTVAAAPDDRSFIIGTYEPGPKGTRATGYQEYRFFRLPISADGKPGHLTELPAYPVPMNAFVEGIALSPDGTLLAVSSMYSAGGQNGLSAAKVEVINLVTGKVRIWTAAPQRGHYYEPGAPSWADGDRMIAFTWQHSQSLTNDNMTMEGVRLLDTDAPGDNLADSRMIVSRKAVSGTIQSALITPDGRDVLMATFRNVPSGGNRGTVIAQSPRCRRRAAGRSACCAPRPPGIPGTPRLPWTIPARYCRSTRPAGTPSFSASSSAGWTLASGGSRPCRLTRPPSGASGERRVTRRWRRRCAHAAGRRGLRGGRTPRSCAGRSGAAT